MKLERDLKDLQADRDRVTSGATSEGCLMEAFLTCCGYMVCDPLWHGYELCNVLHLMVKQSLKAAMKLLKCCIFTPPPPPLRDRVDASSAAGRRPREAPGGRRAEGCPAGRAGTGTRGRGSITCLPGISIQIQLDTMMLLQCIVGSIYRYTVYENSRSECSTRCDVWFEFQTFPRSFCLL